MKKIFFLASRFPYPAKSGRERTLIEYLSFLKGNSEVYFYFFGKRRPSNEVIEEFKRKYQLKEVVFLKLPSLLSSLLRIIRKSFVQRERSIQENIFYSKKIEEFLLNELTEKKIEVVFADMIRTAQYFEYMTGESLLRIFDMDDMISRRFEYLQTQNDINILGSFSKNLPSFVSVLVEKVLRGSILRLEKNLVEKREIEIVDKYDKIILVSPFEVNLLRRKTRKDNIYYLYPSVKVANVDIPVKKIYPSISFMGLLNVPHNEKSLLKFLKEIFPKILKLYPNIQFYIVGANPTKNIKKEVRRYSQNILLTGYVRDFKIFLAKTDVFVAPIYFGTGIKTKILDAMSLGLPVITTPIGAEGLKVTHLENIIIAHTEEEFLRFLNLLLKDKNLRKSIGMKAFQYVNEFHSYERIRRQFLDIIEIHD